MNKSNLKAYAPQARRDFIAAVTARANLLGVSAKAISSSELRGDIAIIEGREWPTKVAVQRGKLIERIKRDGFDQTVDSVAYTWFNRIAALRYMELHDYLDHGWRVLSSRDGGLPEILSHGADAHLSGLDKAKAHDMQLAGNQDNELYKLLLVAQCNELSRSMPFLFEHIDDETELLLPENLLRTDSIIAKLVASVPDEDWEQVEAIGWLYQFYIGEKKDEVIGSVVKSEDIPAATQLFTPNWVVQYLVQNSVGRLWLMANPASTLKSDWPYYIEPAEQTLEVQAQFNDLIKTRMAEDAGGLNPETITVLDPACGSGHILVEAYELLKAIYLERGYRLRDIPRLILEKNLYGLDIDDRAAQLAGFALIMKARADDRRLFDDTITLNVMALQESEGIDDVALANTVFDAAITLEGGDALSNGELFGGGQLATQHSSGLKCNDVRELIQFFAHAKTFGSLLSVPTLLTTKLGKLDTLLQQVKDKGNSLAQSYASQIREHYLLPALTLAKQYDSVIANPPYMGSKGMNAVLKDFAKKQFINSKSDLFAMFIERGFGWCKPSGFNSMVTMQSWMFLSSYEVMREKLLAERTVSSFLQIGYNSFPEINSKIAQACAFSIAATHVHGFVGRYVNLNAAPQSADKNQVFIERTSELVHDIRQEDFKKIPGAPLSYWVPNSVRLLFETATLLSDFAKPRAGLATGDNTQFQRLWFEVAIDQIGFSVGAASETLQMKTKWYPCNSGGAFRKWYGNAETVVNWENDGSEIRNFKGKLGQIASRAQNTECYFKRGVTWTKLGTGSFAARYSPGGFVFDDTGRSAFVNEEDDIWLLLSLMCSSPASFILGLLNPTMSFTSGDIARLPIFRPKNFDLKIPETAASIAKDDWNNSETSWDFSSFPLIKKDTRGINLPDSWSRWNKYCEKCICEMQELEAKNNLLWTEAYGLHDVLSSEVHEDQITLARADREKDCQRLISYAIGCMMGRYSLDETGLIYAQADNSGVDANRYLTFPVDADGIIPLTDELWFDDDAANRVREFLLAVWGAETLDDNVAWLAESLGIKANETPEETIRRYVSANFYKSHLQTYKKRPIYWLFSSGKQGAFQAVVYLHRYNEGTLSRMRAEYVVPLTAKIAARIELVTKDAEQTSSVGSRSKIQKQIEVLRKKQAELLTYDEKLRHYADMRIKLDLDDGVKVNYGKFGDLLAEVKSVTGGVGDD